MQYWLVKSEPFVYSWDQFVKDGRAVWDGVRSYPARLHLNAMRTGDQVLYYHSNEGLAVVGIAEVIKEAYPDPTDADGTWVSVDLKPLHPLTRPVTLAAMKAAPELANLSLIRQSRLSVCPVTPEEAETILQMGGPLPASPAGGGDAK